MTARISYLLLSCALTLFNVGWSTVNEIVGELMNKEIDNPPMMILLSGTPGMGRTTLAKSLEKELNAVRISTSDLRMKLKEQGKSIYEKTDEGIPVVQQLMIDLLAELETKSRNHLYILDGGFNYMVQVQDELEETLEESDLSFLKEYSFYLIRLRAPKAQIIDRIKKSKPSSENYLKYVDHWFKRYQLTKRWPYNFVFDASDEYFGQSYSELVPLLQREIEWRRRLTSSKGS